MPTHLNMFHCTAVITSIIPSLSLILSQANNNYYTHLTARTTWVCRDQKQKHSRF